MSGCFKDESVSLAFVKGFICQNLLSSLKVLILDNNHINTDAFGQLLMNTQTHNLEILSLKDNYIDFKELITIFDFTKIKDLIANREDLVTRSKYIKVLNLTKNANKEDRSLNKKQ
jgi:hypothetical protein